MNPLTEVRFATRRLTRHGGVAALTIAVIAVSVGVTAIVLALLTRVLSGPLGVADAHEVVRFPGVPITKGLTPNLSALRSVEAGAFTAVAAYLEGPVNLLAATAPLEVHAAQATDEFFDVLGVRPRRGRVMTAQDGQDVAIISDRLWVSRYGQSESALGATVTVNGRPLTIIGIVSALEFPVGTDIWLPPGVGTDTMIRDTLIVWVSHACGPARRCPMRPQRSTRPACPARRQLS